MKKRVKSNFANFSSEAIGRIAYFKMFGIDEEVFVGDWNDGVYKGTFIEAKKVITNINQTLFQAIKGLSRLRIKGKSIPKTINLLSLNEGIAYVFESRYFLKEIEKIYTGSASRNNMGFSTKIKHETVRYYNTAEHGRMAELLEDEGFIKIHIDSKDVHGWSNRFYLEKPKATKSDFFNELAKPKHFKELIYPWTGKESDFKYIMDLLNDKINRKELGAFYTPPPYCKKAVKLVRMGIKQVPEGNDYVIVDRPGGTGNLLEFLTDKNVDDITLGELDKYVDKELYDKYIRDKGIVITAFDSGRNRNNITIGELEEQKTNISIHEHIFDNELSHVIVATYEQKEWIVLHERFGDKVRELIPLDIDQNDALIKGGDALEIDVFDKIKPHIEDKNCNIILFENPPYRDSSSVDKDENSKSSKGKFVYEEMKKDLPTLPVNNISTARDIANQFIWSGWKYYLTKPNDCYIVFSPVKYWKSLGLGNKKFIDGYLFNRDHFHSSPSAISCICWQNIDENRDILKLKVFDIIDNKIVDIDEEIEIKKVYNTFLSFFDKRSFKDDIKRTFVLKSNGYEKENTGKRSTVNKNIVGYLQPLGFAINQNNIYLTRLAHYDLRGFYLRSDNFLEKLPLFCAKCYPQTNWYKKNIYFTTADGGNKYTKDINFLKSCLIFTCLSSKNHCISLKGPDDKFYQNKLCFDTDTLASKTLKTYKLNNIEQNLLNTFEEILKEAKKTKNYIKEAKKTKNYNKKYKYGTYQIDTELNTFHIIDDEKRYENALLNTKLIELKGKLSAYYENAIQPKLFQYELLK